MLSPEFSQKNKKRVMFFEFLASSLSNYNSSKTDFFFSTHLGAIRKNVFERVGGFNERYKAASVEDDEFSCRLIAAGVKGKTDMSMIAYHNHRFTFYSWLRRCFIFAILRIPLILQYRNNANIKNQKRRYLINKFGILSSFLILFLPSVVLLSVYLHCGVIFLVWSALYFFVKSEYLLSLRRNQLLISLLLFITDIVILIGALIGFCKHNMMFRLDFSRNVVPVKLNLFLKRGSV